MSERRKIRTLSQKDINSARTGLFLESMGLGVGGVAEDAAKEYADGLMANYHEQGEAFGMIETHRQRCRPCLSKLYVVVYTEAETGKKNVLDTRNPMAAAAFIRIAEHAGVSNSVR